MSASLPGRAVTPEEKRRLVDRLLLAWLANPELRLGQLVVDSTHGAIAPIYYIEDDAFGHMLDKCRRR